jgi:thiol-disulfide isomerase/thioredoxin
MFAAMTCPPARAQTPRCEELQGKYNPEDVVFFVVYSRERHPGEPGYRAFSLATTNAEKIAHARMFGQLTSLPVAVDDIEESTLGLYGNVPNSAYVIDRGGTIVFRSTWADSRKIEQVLDALLESQARLAAGAR